jgi:hypothetical protein
MDKVWKRYGLGMENLSLRLKVILIENTKEITRHIHKK